MRIAIEGLIGVGKSTVLSKLTDVFDVALEPVDQWTLLPLFYKDMRHYAAPFETQVLASFCGPQFSPEHIIMERSPDSAFHVFIKMLHRDAGVLSGSQLQMLRGVYDHVGAHKADAFVYISAPIDVCMQRLQWRNRSAESGHIDAAYLERLHDAYVHFLSTDGRPCKYVVLQGHESPDVVAQLVSNAVMQLKRQ